MEVGNGLAENRKIIGRDRITSVKNWIARALPVHFYTTGCNMVCCQMCGRDTNNKTGICSQCYGTGKSEEYGRKRRRYDQSSMRPAEKKYGDNQETPTEQYHGDSFRDDI